jgi:hypothetical protein
MAYVKSSFLKLVKKDDRIKRMDRVIESNKSAINTLAYIKELENMQASRKFRTFTATEIISNVQKRLIEASVENSAQRSRCVEIKLKCFKLYRVLKKYIETSKIYLLTKYQNDLKIAYSTIKSREDAVNSVLETYIKVIDKLETVIQLADMVIDDIDQSHWSLSLMQKTMEMTYRRE